jgi:peptidoglycan L-alanyl-D-glutamate endopeptidase CwlK
MQKYKFSKSSLENLYNVDGRLQTVAKEVMKVSLVDFAITEGMRTRERQEQLYKDGKTKTMNSKHLEGKAIDICPVINGKLDYSMEAVEDLIFILGLFYFKSVVLSDLYETSGGEKGLNIKLRLGAFWGYETIKQNKEKGFMDAYHIELIN